MPGPLEGIRVVEIASIGPGPFAAMMLADAGADVIRLERAGAAAGLGSGSWDHTHRGRPSVGCNLKDPRGRDLALRLCESADALIEGFRPGVMERLGLGPDEVLARNPKLVYGRMTGWGQDGPLASTAGHDITYLAVTGLLHGIGTADGPPVPPINYVADFGGGAMFLATGLLAALLHARATGEGQVIDAAMTDGAAYLGTMTRVFAANGGWQDRREANLLDGGSPNYRCYATADGRWMAVGALEPQFWAELSRTLELDPALSPYDPAGWDACRAALADAFATRTRDEWAELFAPLDACVAPVLTLEDAVHHPHNVARGTYTEVAGATVPAPAPRFSATPGAPGPVPAVDAAADALLTELGYDDRARAALRAAGAVN